ncbi:hypothetical protein Tco_1045008 [Tanacetum coccineum]|uniref:CCHC-type domain-containing protein n=1 Tax=Tanacetum coccineum TaxID=301880 RepID=A0ABQ5GRI6_9ASTR
MKFSVFKCSKEDSIGKPSYNRFTKTNDFKGVPPPLSGDYTPIPQEEIDDTLYVYSKKGPQQPEISVSDESTFEHSSCQSNDSKGSCENISEHSFETESESLSEPNEMSKSRLEVTNEKDVSAPKAKEVEPSCVSHIKTPRQPLKDKETHKVNRKSWNDMMERELGEGYSFTKKKCFVCGSLSHLIKDCDYYEKKMAREAEVKRVVNTGNGVAKPVWTNANRINHANQFVPRSVQLNAGRPKFNSVRPNINTGRTNINSGRPKVNAVSPKVNTVRSKQPKTLCKKKSGKRRKQMARKGMHTSVDIDDSEDSDDVGEQEESTTGEKGVYQIVREDGTDIVYINFGAMLKSISRDDLTELYRIVMNRYGLDGPEDKLEKGFWKCLRIMFEEPLSTDSIWSELGQQKIISWRYYDTCRVHCLNLESMEVYMLSERKYPLSAEVCQTMLKMKLLDGKMNEDCYRLLKMMEKQAGIRK